MSYLEDIKVFQETSPDIDRHLDVFFRFRCNELITVCRICSLKHICSTLGTLRIPLSVIEETLKSHPELLV